MKFNKRLIITLAVAFVVGLTAGYLWYAGDSQKASARVETRITIPEEGIRTAEFPVRLLQAALQARPEGNVVVAPNALTAQLTRMRELAGGPAKAALDKLALPGDLLRTATPPYEVAMIFPDSGLCIDGSPQGSDIHPVPFRKNEAEARATIGKTVSLCTDKALDGSSISSYITAWEEEHARGSRPAIISTHGCAFKAAWVHQPTHVGASEGNFFNEDGKPGKADMYKHTGNYRVVKAEDGSWTAAAVFFCNELPEGDSVCLVVVLPQKTSIREFVTNELTPDKLNEIRTALAHATPVSCSITMPDIGMPATTQDARPLWEALGLGSLFTETAPFPALTGTKEAPLSFAMQQHAISLNEDAAPQDQEGEAPQADSELMVDHPFLWFIGDLTSPCPPYLMGTVEKL